MKKLIFTVIILLSLSVNSYSSEINLIESKTFKYKNCCSYVVQVLCVSGYKFVFNSFDDTFKQFIPLQKCNNNNNNISGGTNIKKR